MTVAVLREVLYAFRFDFYLFSIHFPAEDITVVPIWNLFNMIKFFLDKCPLSLGIWEGNAGQIRFMILRTKISLSQSNVECNYL